MTTPAPSALPVVATAIPTRLRERAQWVTWAYALRDGRPTKVPHTTKGAPASSTDPATWAPFPAVLAAAGAQDADGVGYVLTTADGIVGVDLDHCRDPESGTLTAWAAEIVALLCSYTEVTPSGTGIRVFALGTMPPGRRKHGDVEAYTEGRFLTVTGARLPDSPPDLVAATPAIATVYARYLTPPDRDVPLPSAQPHLPPPPLTDTDILERARRARNSAKIAALWAGDKTGYPSASEAHAALASELAFYTSSAGQLERLLSQSAIADHPKWRRADYRQRTVAFALSGSREHYRALAPAAPPTNGNGHHAPPALVEPPLPEGPPSDPAPSVAPVPAAAPTTNRPIIEALDAYYERLMARTGELGGISTGLADLDDLIDGLGPAQVIVVSAPTSGGKSAFGLALALTAARSGRQVQVFSLEMSEDDYCQRILAAESGVAGTALRRGAASLSPDQLDRLTEAFGRATERYGRALWLDPNPTYTVRDLAAVAAARRAATGLDLILVDYVQLLEATPGWYDRHELGVKASMSGVLQLAKALNVPVVVLSQENEAGELRESRTIGHTAHIWIKIKANLDPEEIPSHGRVAADLVVMKNRNGAKGTVHATWDLATNRFYGQDIRQVAL